MAENMYTLGLGRLDVPYNTTVDIRISLDIIGGAVMQDPFAGLVFPPTTQLIVVSTSSPTELYRNETKDKHIGHPP
jgi:hypothetical protein